jgi:NAD(P)-dependent dehydrogenase (short-subunit alcohol dehydrogenase family)
MADETIAAEIEVGLADPIKLTRKLLARHQPLASERRNYCYIGSTSAYAGFRHTSVYCAVKHGLLGFVRAMNDEYAASDTRFWLFSMGSMRTEMGAKLAGQDPESFLKPGDVAGRIVEAVCSPSNLFEPEVLIRRRTIRFLEK